MKLNELREQFRKANVGIDPAVPGSETTGVVVARVDGDGEVKAEVADAYGLSTLDLPATMPWWNMKELVRRKAVDEYGWPEEGTLVYRTNPGASHMPSQLIPSDMVYIGTPDYTSSLVHPSIEVEGFDERYHPHHTKLRFHIPRYKAGR